MASKKTGKASKVMSVIRERATGAKKKMQALASKVAAKPPSKSASRSASRSVAAKKPAPAVEKATAKNAKAVAAKAAPVLTKVKAAPKAKPAASQGEVTPAKGGTLAVGDRAPSFKLLDDNGKEVSSDSLRGSPYVLYFYPKDDTPGCTLEACGFRDSLPRFSAKGVKVLGVSPDPIASHERFKKKYGLTFPLLSDPEKTLANAYGVWVMKQNYGREYLGIERSTFVIDGKGVIRQVHRRVRVLGHVDALLGSV